MAVGGIRGHVVEFRSSILPGLGYGEHAPSESLGRNEEWRRNERYVVGRTPTVVEVSKVVEVKNVEAKAVEVKNVEVRM
jgi:hypothetical protein